MSERFYFPQTLVPGREALLEDAEAHHLSQVLRIGPGTEVTLFDGAGGEATASVLSASKRGVHLHIDAVRHESTEPVRRVVLATAVPKGDRFRFLVEKATELGVHRLQPLSTHRSVVDPRDAKLDKMRQCVIAACKQSRRNRLMEIAPTLAFRDWVGGGDDRGTLLLADPEGTLLRPALEGLPAGQPMTAVIGPEGGFTPEERETALRAGALAVSLGPHILRIETAALALAAFGSIS